MSSLAAPNKKKNHGDGTLSMAGPPRNLELGRATTVRANKPLSGLIGTRVVLQAGGVDGRAVGIEHVFGVRDGFVVIHGPLLVGVGPTEDVDDAVELVMGRIRVAVPEGRRHEIDGFDHGLTRLIAHGRASFVLWMCRACTALYHRAEPPVNGRGNLCSQPRNLETGRATEPGVWPDLPAGRGRATLRHAAPPPRERTKGGGIAPSPDSIDSLRSGRCLLGRDRLRCEPCARRFGDIERNRPSGVLGFGCTRERHSKPPAQTLGVDVQFGRERLRRDCGLVTHGILRSIGGALLPRPVSVARTKRCAPIERIGSNLFDRIGFDRLNRSKPPPTGGMGPYTNVCSPHLDPARPARNQLPTQKTPKGVST